MRKPAISVENLSKQYQIRKPGAGNVTFREAAVGAMLSPFRRIMAMGKGETQSDPFLALNNVNFKIAEGEVVGFVGRNGAGKSTLLKVLSRIVEPTTGEVRMRGRVSSLLEVGTGFHPELTGRENIFLNGAILGMKKAEIIRNFDAIVAFAEVEKFLDTPVKFYSSGMYVRLAFAVAAHLEPEILIVDEVLAVGDAAFQKKCLGRMGSVAQEGRTILFVSHNMAAVKALCTRAIWLNGGKVHMDGPATTVVDAYLRAFNSVPQSDYDLSERQREGHNGEQLRVTRLLVNDGEPVYHGQPLKLRIEYQTTAEVVGLSLGLGFATLDGIRICSMDTDLSSEDRPTIPANTKGAVEVELDYLDLEPGTYLFDIGGRSGDRFCLDYIAGCGQVEIFAGPETPTNIIGMNGGVRARGKWSWVGANANAESKFVTA